jgi:hypothetical protein
VSFSAILTNDKVTVSGFGQGIEGEKEADFFLRKNLKKNSYL